MDNFTKNHLKVLYAIILFFCAGLVCAADLLEIYGHALESDPQYRQVAATKRAVQEQRPQARAQLLPELSFSANAFTNEQEIESVFNPIGQEGKVSFGSHGYSLDLTQPLFHGDRIIQYLQSDNLIKQADAELVAAEQDLLIRTTAAYFEVLAAYDNLGFAEAEEKSLRRNR